jgi:hypothetical protein
MAGASIEALLRTRQRLSSQASPGRGPAHTHREPDEGPSDREALTHLNRAGRPGVISTRAP